MTLARTNHQDAEPSIGENYNQYFLTGTYKQRYPGVNHHVLNMIVRQLEAYKNPTIIDYGCGTGRYLMALLDLSERASFSAYDISSASLDILKDSLKDKQQLERVTINYQLHELEHSFANEASSADIALLLFGVLSHINSATARKKILHFLHSALSKKGSLILSVPNKQRRFRQLQAQQNTHAITYHRTINGKATRFYYHLYDVDSIREELTQAGFSIQTIQAESLIPESWVTRFSFLGWLDQQLCRWLPARWGYGILIRCQPNKY